MRPIRTTPRERARCRMRQRVRVTGRVRKLSAEEIRAHEDRLRRDGILPRATSNERI
jgi:hypothetical protein